MSADGTDGMPTGDDFMAAYARPELADPPLPGARLIRHSCPTPEAARGMVWRCGCGRRWKSVQRFVPERPSMVWGLYVWQWRRTFWPWPR